MRLLHIFRLTALVLALSAALFAFIWPLATRNSAQDLPAASKSTADEFVLVRGENGEVVCREALPEDKAWLDNVNPTGLRQINHLDEKSPTAAGGLNTLPAHLTIILRATAQLEANATAKAAFVAAAANWENRIKSPVTIYIDVDYGTTNFGAAWPGGVLGSTSSPTITSGYQAVRSRLQLGASNANETTIYNSLPLAAVPTDTGDVSTVNVSNSIARAIGLLDPTAQPTDPAARIGFNSTIVTYDFSPGDGITSGTTDFDAVATHEIGHALGFSSRSGTTGTGAITPAMWDLYRFRTGTTAGTFQTAPRIMTIGGPVGNNTQWFFAPGASFAPPGTVELGLSTGGPSGSTSNNGDGRQSSHWKLSSRCDGDPLYIGIMDPAIPGSCRRSITSNDDVTANILGYNYETNAAPPATPTPPPPPNNDNFVNAQPIAGCNGSTTGTNISATSESGEPSNPVSPGSTRSVWYSWTAPSTGSATLDTHGSNYDTTLAIFTGSTLNTLSLVPNGSNDDTGGGDTTSTVTISVTSGVTYRIAIDGFNNGGSGGDTGNIQLNWSASCAVANTVQFSQSSYTVNESSASLSINVTRTGNTAGAATVKYSTSDATDVNFLCNPSTMGQITGVASRKCDYHIASGRLRFAPGETTKVIVLSIVNDVYVEGPEALSISLSNSTGATLGNPNTATVTITESEAPGQANPIDGTAFYVRMLYVDLLSREPDPAGFNGWIHRIDFCGQPGEPPPPCDRVTVGGDGFLRSNEFFDREFFVIRLYRTALGRIPRYDDVADLAYVSGFLTDADLELNKQDLVAEIMTRSEFGNVYNALGNAQYVDTMISTAGVTPAAGVRDGWVNALNASTKTRAQVFRELSERAEVSARYLHEAQVVSCYYGFFTRNPDGAYLDFLQRYDAGQINLGDLANAFINAAEYRQRFGP